MDCRGVYLWLWLAHILWWFSQRTYGCDKLTDARHVRCVGEVTPPGFQVRLPGCLTPCDVPRGLHTKTGRCDFEDVDECGLKLYDCSVNSYCVNTVGSYLCQCLPGYAEQQDSICDDINECRAGLHNCTINEICINSDGSYSCECMSGFSRDGQQCEDINECVAGLHNCTINEICINIDGSYSCECISGFSWDGQQCVDINECSAGLHNCTINEICINSDGSFSCECMTGFFRDGQQCVDINECVAGLHNCTINGICVNTVGSYSCVCSLGFTWDGQQCVANPYRSDGQCGAAFIAPNGEVAICNKDDGSYCCSNLNWCGNSELHCSCPGCIDYRTDSDDK